MRLENRDLFAKRTATIQQRPDSHISTNYLSKNSSTPDIYAMPTGAHGATIGALPPPSDYQQADPAALMYLQA